MILKDLPMGKSIFDYELTDSFFKLINDEESDVKRGTLDVKVVVNRLTAAFDLAFKINGKVFTPCDRCLDDVAMEVDTQQKLIVKFGKEYAEESDEIVVVPEDEGEINISWFIYEFIILSLPAKRVHPAGECNKVTSQKLRQHKVTDPNDEDGNDDLFEDDDDSDAGQGNTDPRWDALRDYETD